MQSRKPSRVKLYIEGLENRAVPAVLTPIEGPGLEAVLGDHGRIGHVKSAKAHAHDRSFHAEDSGIVVINGDLGIGTTITASASGHATHLGPFTLNDSSTVVGVDGAIRYIEGEAVAEVCRSSSAVRGGWGGRMADSAEEGWHNLSRGAAVRHVRTNGPDRNY